MSAIPAALLTIAALTLGTDTEAQTTAVPDDLIIKLERTACHGECPVYTVTIDARGSVVYEGTQFVRVVGRHTDRIPVSRVVALLDTAERLGFFGLQDQYRGPVTDLPTTFVTIAREGRSKRVEDYYGSPEGLKELERQIDEAARTRRWILLDGQTLEQLLRDGWSPTPEERADFLRRALGQDEVEVVRGLIDIGADPNGTYFETNTTPLMMVRSAGAARLLLNVGANPNARNDNGITPLRRSAYLAPEVAEVLLKAGAHVNEPADEADGTPLLQAACFGNVRVVSVLLDAGANPAARTTVGKSALECARETRDSQRLHEPAALNSKSPYLKDFDGVITLLEQAIAKRVRR